jgi:hypothetical protein
MKMKLTVAAVLAATCLSLPQTRELLMMLKLAVV